MPILKLSPSCKSYLWGGSKLKDIFHKSYEGEVLAETWELSCHKEGESFISEGPFQGITLSSYIERHGKQILGTNCGRFEQFPIIIKLIDAKEQLSVQVHPDDNYALEREGQYGKTELWYVVDTEDNAELYCGFCREITKDEFIQHIRESRLPEVLQSHKVKMGDVFLIEAGTIHAIGGGIVIAEIQQNSTLTYRVYDYGRCDSGGKTRPLHIEKALDVIHFKPQAKAYDFGGHLGSCSYFTVDKIGVDVQHHGNASQKSFLHLLILDGEGTLSDTCGSTAFQRGDSLFICAGTGNFSIRGQCQALQTSIPEA
ncbi:MAG: mannose-6-phosphate isomerase [Clostridia bacterium]|nr:mannose-6-phosphate isomerase [Clostridia bacterium]